MKRPPKQPYYHSRPPESSSDDEQRPGSPAGPRALSSLRPRLHSARGKCSTDSPFSPRSSDTYSPVGGERDSPLLPPPTKRSKVSTQPSSSRRPVVVDDSSDAFQEPSRGDSSYRSRQAQRKKTPLPSLDSDPESIVSSQAPPPRKAGDQTCTAKPRLSRAKPDREPCETPKVQKQPGLACAPSSSEEEEEEEEEGGDEGSDDESIEDTQEGEVLASASELHMSTRGRGAYLTADTKSHEGARVDYSLQDGCHCAGCMLPSCGVCHICQGRTRRHAVTCVYRPCEVKGSAAGVGALISYVDSLPKPTITVAEQDGGLQLHVTLGLERQFTVTAGCCVVLQGDHIAKGGRGSRAAAMKDGGAQGAQAQFYPTYLAYVRDIVLQAQQPHLHVNYFSRYYDTFLSFPALRSQVDELFLYVSDQQCGRADQLVHAATLLGLADVEFVQDQQPSGTHRFYCRGMWYNSKGPTFESASLHPFLLPTDQVASDCPGCKANAGPVHATYTLQDRHGQAIHDAYVEGDSARSLCVQHAGSADQTYHVGDCVYINPGNSDGDLQTFMPRLGHPDTPCPPARPNTSSNSKLCPERHRGCVDAESYLGTYQVGLVTGLSRCHGATRVHVRMLHRPSQLPADLLQALSDEERDRYRDVPCLLVLSSDTFTIKVQDQASRVHRKLLLGPARVAYVDPRDAVHVRLMEMAALRMEVHYFTHCYDRIGQAALLSVTEEDARWFDKAPVVAHIHRYLLRPRPLVIVDVFCGGGGLSEACRQLGLGAEAMHSIEVDVEVGAVFRANHGTMAAKLHCCDLSYLVRQFGLEKGTRSLTLQDLQGKVDLVIAGPVCHGFTQQNRRRSSARSQFKRLLVGQLLVLVEMVQPSWLLMENVAAMANYDKSSHINAAVRMLLSAGYQVSVMKLQAGNYGVPQWRQRLFVWAARGTLPLPKSPAPLFQTRMVGGNDTQTRLRIVPERGGQPVDMVLHVDRRAHCPYRPLWAHDVYSALQGLVARAMDDTEAAARTEPTTVDVDGAGWYVRTSQYWAQYGRAMATDPGQDPLHVIAGLAGRHVHVHTHVHKKLPRVVQARVGLVPTADVLDSADWCDIANRPKGGLKALTYSSMGPDGRPVLCPCQDKKCSRKRQENTCIPYVLAHSTKRHLGCLGRQSPYRPFPTIVGRVDVENKPWQLHPYENRQHTILEQSLAQGLPLDYLYPCSVAKAQMVTGSYVPVPMGACILLQLKAALVDMDYRSVAETNQAEDQQRDG